MCIPLPQMSRFNEEDHSLQRRESPLPFQCTIFLDTLLAWLSKEILEAISQLPFELEPIKGATNQFHIQDLGSSGDSKWAPSSASCQLMHSILRGTCRCDQARPSPWEGHILAWFKQYQYRSCAWLCPDVSSVYLRIALRGCLLWPSLPYTAYVLPPSTLPRKIDDVKDVSDDLSLWSSKAYV